MNYKVEVRYTGGKTIVKLSGYEWSQEFTIEEWDKLTHEVDMTLMRDEERKSKIHCPECGGSPEGVHCLGCSKFGKLNLP